MPFASRRTTDRPSYALQVRRQALRTLAAPSADPACTGPHCKHARVHACVHAIVQEPTGATLIGASRSWTLNGGGLGTSAPGGSATAGSWTMWWAPQGRGTRCLRCVARRLGCVSTAQLCKCGCTRQISFCEHPMVVMHEGDVFSCISVRNEKENYLCSKTLPASIREKETSAQSAVSLLYQWQR